MMLPSMGNHTYHLLPRQRFQMVSDHLGGHKVANICRFYGIPRKTFYYWFRVWQSDPENFKKNIVGGDHTPNRMPYITDAGTVDLIVRLRRRSKFGPAKLQLLLRERGIVMSVSGIAKVLKREGLSKKRKKKTKKKYKKYTAFMTFPGQKVQVDVAYLPKLFGKTHRYYVYQAIDLYTRMTFSAIYSECNPQNTVHFLKRVNHFFPFAVKLFQFDHGTEFTYDMLVHVKTDHPVHIFLNSLPTPIPFCFSPVATPRMNGCVERVHRTFREEVERWHKWNTPSQMEKDHLKWLRYYNEKRPHFGLKLQTPLLTLRRTKTFENASLQYSI